MLERFKAFLGIDGGERGPVQVGRRMSEPEAQMWAGALREQGIGAGVRNDGIPPYTSPMAPTYTVWVSAEAEERARGIMTGKSVEEDSDETT